MYMFFWFFKQLFYILKRFTKHKLLLLFVFFVIAIFFFLKPSFAVVYPNIYTDILNNNANIKKVYDNTWNYYHNQYGDNLAIVIFRNNDGTITSNCYNPSNVTFYFNNDNFCVRSSNSSTTFGASWYYDNGDNRTHTNYNLSGDNVTTYTKALYLYSNIYLYDTETVVVRPSLLPNPVITTSSSSIVNFSFNNLTINAQDLPYNDSYELQFTYPNNSTKITGEINQYKSIQNNKLVFNIPKSWISQNIVIRSGSVITFDLLQYHREGNAVTLEQYSMGGYTLSLTSQEQQEANEDSNKQLLSDISQNQQQTTQAVENLENTITDSNVADDSIFLPSLDVNDPTQVGINNIFDLLYNAFTTGDAEDIVLPFPFTNKTITIPGNLTYNVLHNNGGDILIRIIRAYWWYKIASFIAYDVFSKLKTIQEGNIEDVQKENIKGDML